MQPDIFGRIGFFLPSKWTLSRNGVRNKVDAPVGIYRTLQVVQYLDN